MRLSVVIPAYNESANIVKTVSDIIGAIKGSGMTGYGIIVVDDHSDDGTFEKIRSSKLSGVSCIRLSRRSGSHTAIRAGLKSADGDAVLCIAADGQEDARSISEMVAKWRAGAKIVWGLRRDRKTDRWHVRRLAQLFYSVLSMLGGSQDTRIDLSRADFFLLDRSVTDAMNSCIETNTSLFGLLAWMGFTTDSVEYDRKPRASGRTKWSFRSRVRLAKDWIIAFSGLPLKMMSSVGFFIAVAGFIYGLYLVINYLVGSPAPGWSSIMVAILILGGIQMIMLGIIGEYLWRNLDESRKRPLYFIEAAAKAGEAE